MSYVSDAEIYLPFDGSLLDLVSGTPLITSSSPTYVDGVFNQGIDLENSFTATESSLNSLTNQFTIGFWLNPVNPGMVTNTTTGLTESLKMPLFSKSAFSYSSSTGLTTPSATKFIIWEETQSNGTNLMKITVNGASSSATYISKAYTTGTFHHFWIVYNGVIPSIQVYVDLTLDGGMVIGAIPSSLPTSSYPFGINLGLAGAQYNTALNEGTLDDLVVFNSARDSVNDIYRAITFGAPYVIDSVLSLTDEIDQAVVFNDSTTIQITAMFGNRGNIYAGRSDGKILQGVRTLWESRRDFSNDDEINFMSIITRSATDNLTIGNGILNITNAIVRV